MQRLLWGVTAMKRFRLNVWCKSAAFSLLGLHAPMLVVMQVATVQLWRRKHRRMPRPTQVLKRNVCIPAQSLRWRHRLRRPVWWNQLLLRCRARPYQISSLQCKMNDGSLMNPNGEGTHRSHKPLFWTLRTKLMAPVLSKWRGCGLACAWSVAWATRLNVVSNSGKHLFNDIRKIICCKSPALHCTSFIFHVGTARGVTRLDGARGKNTFGAPIRSNLKSFGIKCAVEESTCNIVGSFQRPPQWFGSPIMIRRPGNCASLDLLVTPLVTAHYWIARVGV